MGNLLFWRSAHNMTEKCTQGKNLGAFFREHGAFRAAGRVTRPGEAFQIPG